MASSAILNFTDPYPYQAAVRGAQLEFLPTEKGDFRAELTKVTFESLWMQRGKESLARVFRGAVAPDRAVIGFLTDLDQPEYRHCGADVSPGAIIVDDHNEMYRQTKAACRWGAMSLKTEAFVAAGTALIGRPVGQVVSLDGDPTGPCSYVAAVKAARGGGTSRSGRARYSRQSAGVSGA